jgi:hypothetical protein
MICFALDVGTWSFVRRGTLLSRTHAANGTNISAATQYACQGATNQGARLHFLEKKSTILANEQT